MVEPLKINLANKYNKLIDAGLSQRTYVFLSFVINASLYTSYPTVSFPLSYRALQSNINNHICKKW